MAPTKTRPAQRKYVAADYVNQTFGFLTILEPIDKKNLPPDFDWRSLIGHLVRCQCVCGATYFGSVEAIVNGRTKSCGCMSKRKKYIGRRFGRLVVKGKDGSSPKYVCLCDCGTAVSVFRSALYSGNTRSCGCLKESRRKPASTNK